MTIIDPKDLDKRMGMVIDPNSIPKHNGGSQGSMQAQIRRGSDEIIDDQGHGRRGAPVFDESEVGGQDFYGSQTVISVNDAPPLPQKFEPQAAAPASSPAPAPAVPAAPRSAQELLAQMGLMKKR